MAKNGEVSEEAKKRLRWFDYWKASGGKVSLTCRHFCISRQTFYYWKRRYEEQQAKGLATRSCRPKHVRQRSWSPALVAAVKRLRLQYPRWGKDKLAVLIKAEGIACSVSTVGRILSNLKLRRQLVEPVKRTITARKAREYARRKPKDYQVVQPGDLVQVDTVDVRPLPGVVLKQFTACDVISRWDVLGLASRATAGLAKRFLDDLLARTPFPIRAVQVDGGSEFKAEFEQACTQRGLALFCLPPRSPKLNGAVERANRTHTEEFWEVAPLTSWTVADLLPVLRDWETTYNHIRPHRALNYCTPAAYLEATWPELRSAGTA